MSFFASWRKASRLKPARTRRPARIATISASKNRAAETTSRLPPYGIARSMHRDLSGKHSTTTSPAALVARSLAIQEELLIAHRYALRMMLAQMLQVGVVVRHADDHPPQLYGSRPTSEKCPAPVTEPVRNQASECGVPCLASRCGPLLHAVHDCTDASATYGDSLAVGASMRRARRAVRNPNTTTSTTIAMNNSARPELT